MATWKELEAQGVKRCCAVFTSGRQCRRRAAEKSGFCAKHGPQIERMLAPHRAIVRAEADGSLYRQRKGDSEE
jgi:hypothetical protein